MFARIELSILGGRHGCRSLAYERLNWGLQREARSKSGKDNWPLCSLRQGGLVRRLVSLLAVQLSSCLAWLFFFCVALRTSCLLFHLVFKPKLCSYS